GLDERLLRELLGDMAVTDAARAVEPQAREVPPIQLVERAVVARLVREHQPPVAVQVDRCVLLDVLGPDGHDHGPPSIPTGRASSARGRHTVRDRPAQVLPPVPPDGHLRARLRPARRGDRPAAGRASRCRPASRGPRPRPGPRAPPSRRSGRARGSRRRHRRQRQPGAAGPAAPGPADGRPGGGAAPRTTRRGMGGADPPQPAGPARRGAGCGPRRGDAHPAPAPRWRPLDRRGGRRPGAGRHRAAAAVHPRAAGRPGALSDRIRAAGGLGRGADRGPAPHRRAPRALQARGAAVASVELAVGADTFRPVTEARVEDHPIHSESFDVPDATIAACRDARRVIAIGTTVVRALESVAATGTRSGRTSLFITRGFEFRTVDVLLTNFHVPRSTLLALIDAFVGPRWRDLYGVALASGYRFLSFGDAMLVERAR